MKEDQLQAESAASVDISSTYYTSQIGSNLYVGTGGDVKVDMLKKGTVTFTNVQDGSYLPIKITKVYKTGTTASDMLALW